ncbi:hypothetical protein AB5N19_11720 [Seiridium cardinale]|uniref:Myb-like domain-containing protein n=1 Tax=Seiridium cardinale TaxID=138064 RepID=A0ABR2XE73_9PEZI
MPPKKQTAGEAAEASQHTLTDSEVKVIDAIFTHSPASLKLTPDWEAVREALGSASVESVKKRYQIIVQKRGWFKAAETGPSTPSSKKAPSARSSAKKRQNPLTEADGDVADGETPTKMRKVARKEILKQEEEV